MATIINNPNSTEGDASSGVGIIVGVIIAIILIVLFIIYGIPALQNQTAPGAPATGGPSTNVNVTIPAATPAPTTNSGY